jgi:hypothetical protein
MVNYKWLITMAFCADIYYWHLYMLKCLINLTLII